MTDLDSKGPTRAVVYNGYIIWVYGMDSFYESPDQRPDRYWLSEVTVKHGGVTYNRVTHD